MVAKPETRNDTVGKQPRSLGDAWRLLVQSALARGGAHVEKPVIDVQELKNDIKQAVENIDADQK